MSIHSHKPTRIFCTVQTKFSMQLKHINHSKHKPLHSQNMQYPEFFCSVRLYQIIIIFMDSEHSVLPNLLRSLCRFFLWIFSTQISTLLRWSVSYLYLDAVLFSALLFVCFLPGWAYTSVVLSIDTLVLFLGIKASPDDSGESTGETPRFSALLLSTTWTSVLTLWIFQTCPQTPFRCFPLSVGLYNVNTPSLLFLLASLYLQEPYFVALITYCISSSSFFFFYQKSIT